METQPVIGTPVPPSNVPPQLTPHRSNKRLVFSIAAVVAVMLVVIVGAYCYLHSQPRLPKTLYFSYSLEGQVFTLDTKTEGAAAQPFLPSLDGDYAVTDMAEDADQFFFILSSPTTGQNIYARSKTGENTSLRPLTNTKTAKSGLSYDAPSHTLSYISSELVTDPDAKTPTYKRLVTVIDTETGEQKIVAEGTRATVVPGGKYALVQNGMSVSAVSTLSGTQTSLFTIQSGAVYAVSSDGMTVAMYNAQSKNIDFFDIHAIPAVSFKESQPAPFTPSALTYIQNRLLVVGANDAKPPVYIQFMGEKKPVATLSDTRLKLPARLFISAQ